MKIIEKKHRLSLNSYKGRVACSFTLCLKDRKKFFINDVIFSKFTEMLKVSLTKYDCKNYIFLFMPDHLHLIIEGNSERSDLRKTIIYFKQKTGFWLSKNFHNIRWQKDFYDHIIKKDEDLKKHIRYILDNPVRKGLVQKWEEYKYKGSIDFDLLDLL